MLNRYPVSQGTQIVAKSQNTRRLDSAKNGFFVHKEHSFHGLYIVVNVRINYHLLKIAYTSYFTTFYVNCQYIIHIMSYIFHFLDIFILLVVHLHIFLVLHLLEYNLPLYVQYMSYMLSYQNILFQLVQIKLFFLLLFLYILKLHQ